MKILGIETSCDETSVAVVAEGRYILSNLVASQVELHARYGGIVPEVASRQHLLAIVPLLRGALAQAKVSWEDLSGVAVTIGPGLAGSLLVGVNVAKALALARGLPLTGVNHLEGHLYANWLREEDPAEDPSFPLVCLIASGGHTQLILARGYGDYLSLGKTRDDAAGEAFDKVARILGLGYPGGPAIEKAARGQKATPVPRPWLKGSLDFSFSGLKTALLRRAEALPPAATTAPPDEKRLALAAGFQEAVVEVMVAKTLEAAREYGAREILLAGGVAANAALRQVLAKRSPLPLRCPSPRLCTDNAAMIAACGYFHFQAGDWANWDLEVDPNLPLA